MTFASSGIYKMPKAYPSYRNPSSKESMAPYNRFIARPSFELLEKVVAEIIQEVPGIVSVTCNIAPKPPLTIEAV